MALLVGCGESADDATDLTDDSAATTTDPATDTAAGAAGDETTATDTPDADDVAESNESDTIAPVTTGASPDDIDDTGGDETDDAGVADTTEASDDETSPSDEAGSEGESGEATLAPALPPAAHAMPIEIDVGGVPPTAPETAERLAELDGFLASRSIPTDQTGLLAYYSADRGTHLVIANAAIEAIDVMWKTTDDGGGEVDTAVEYLLDGAGLDEQAVSSAIQQALVDAGFADVELDEGEHFDEPLLSVEVDGFRAEVVGVPSDPDSILSEAFIIRTRATHDDVAPVVLGPTAPLLEPLDALSPAGPLDRLRLGVSMLGLPTERTALRRSVPGDVGSYPDFVARLKAEVDDAVGEESTSPSEFDDWVRFSFTELFVEGRLVDDDLIVVEVGRTDTDIE